MNPDTISSVITHHRRILKAQITADPYLSAVANRFPTHRFLGNCTQAVFQRQVLFLSKVIQQRLGKAGNDVNVLDWGCGKGHITYLLRKQGFNVTACDRQDPRDDSAFGQETPIIGEQNINVVPLRDAVALPFESGSFDCVVSSGVLEHVADDLGSLKEIRRILTPQGLLFVTFLPYHLSWTQAAARIRGNDYHDRLYWRRRVSELAFASGLSVQGMWFGQLFPKNSVPLSLDPIFEPIDRALCSYSPLKYFATNIEAILTVIA
jgi:SAM-dependent methyltransferase